MRNTLKITLFFVVLVAVLLLVPSIVNAADVATGDDLVSAVNNATDNEVINLTTDVTLTTAVEVSNKTITINGNGFSIIGSENLQGVSSPANKTLITAMQGSKVTLQNVTLKDSPKYGVQAYNGGHVVLNNVTINNCEYGGVLNNGARVEIIDLTLGFNGTPSNNGIELGKGQLLPTEIKPVLVMNGTLKSEQKENVIYIASNDELTEFEVENTETSTDKLYISGNKVVVTDENNSVKFESNESDRTTADSGEEFIPNVVVTLNVQGSETPITFEVKKGTVLTKADLEAKVTVPENYQYDGFYIDAEYKTSFDFRTEINENTTIYVKFTPAGPIEEPTNPTDPSDTEEPTTPSEEEPVDGEKDETPKTGVSTYIGVAAFVVVASVATMVVLKKKNS